jgi:hypothetical protein
LLCQQTMKRSAMAIGPLHHGGNGKAFNAQGAIPMD